MNIFAGKTDIGLKRKNNEDAFIVRKDLGMCVACDGMGGAAAGELASRIFTDTAIEVFEKDPGRSEDEINYLTKKTFGLANDRIQSHIEKNPRHAGMGCTAELLAFSDKSFVLGHIGDSRTYLLREGVFKQITQDHTLVQEQLEAGLIPMEEARNHPLRNVILRAVGVKKELVLDLFKGNIFSGDLFVLCSDGLTDMVDDSQILETLDGDNDIEQSTETLIKMANDAGGKDNITVVMANVL